MKKYTDEEIEEFYARTVAGCYLKACAMNDPGEAGGFYKNQLGHFTAGFRCCEEKFGEDGEGR